MAGDSASLSAYEGSETPVFLAVEYEGEETGKFWTLKKVIPVVPK